MLAKIISGGQTGADQAALDFAIENDIPHGGWIPKGRMTEEGPLPDKYQLQEMPTKSYPKRTEKNILDSDGTLIVSHGTITGGTALTRKLAKKQGKPWNHMDLNKITLPEASDQLQTWIQKNDIEVMNVAGARASNDVKIYDAVKSLLRAL
jgi:Circularly permutated YpsA SLOG family